MSRGGQARASPSVSGTHKPHRERAKTLAVEARGGASGCDAESSSVRRREKDAVEARERSVRAVTLAVEAKDVGMSDWPRGRSGLVLEFGREGAFV